MPQPPEKLSAKKGDLIDTRSTPEWATAVVELARRAEMFACITAPDTDTLTRAMTIMVHELAKQGKYVTQWHYTMGVGAQSLNGPDALVAGITVPVMRQDNRPDPIVAVSMFSVLAEIATDPYRNVQPKTYPLDTPS